MQKQLQTDKQIIPYDIKISRRARSLRLAVYCDSSVVLTVPRGLDFGRAENFLRQKINWIVDTLESFKPYRPRTRPSGSRKEYLSHQKHALSLAQSKVRQWNEFYGFSYAKVNVKNQKTRWGSCSRKGNLNFNYRIIHLPEELLDYLIVHELCHLKEFNHSSRFWALVGQSIPDYKVLRKRLRSYQGSLAK